MKKRLPPPLPFDEICATAFGPVHALQYVSEANIKKMISHFRSSTEEATSLMVYVDAGGTVLAHPTKGDRVAIRFGNQKVLGHSVCEFRINNIRRTSEEFIAMMIKDSKKELATISVKNLGTVSVDSGSILIIDPCYTTNEKLTVLDPGPGAVFGVGNDGTYTVRALMQKGQLIKVWMDVYQDQEDELKRMEEREGR